MKFPSLNNLSAASMTIQSGDSVYTAYPAIQVPPVILRLALGSNIPGQFSEKVLKGTMLFRMMAVFAARDYDGRVFTLLLTDYPMIGSLMKGIVDYTHGFAMQVAKRDVPNEDLDWNVVDKIACDSFELMVSEESRASYLRSCIAAYAAKHSTGRLAAYEAGPGDSLTLLTA